MREEEIRPGDAIFFNYGWSKLWKEPEKYVENWAGIGMEVAQWIVERQASMIGSDGVGTEVLRNPDPDLFLPVHQELIMKHGIFNLENITFEDLIQDKGYEFLFIFTPLRIKGATGSAARPLAIR